MKLSWQAAAAMTIACAAAAPAAAVTFVGTHDVTLLNNADPGLVVQTAPKNFGLNFDLDLDSATVMPASTGWTDLFQIWTDETSVNSDDLVPKEIKVAFNFTQPSPGFDGEVTGDTAGRRYLFGVVQKGVVTWDDAPAFAFNGDGRLKVQLSDTIFNPGLFGLRQGGCSSSHSISTFGGGSGTCGGRAYAGTVQAKFVLEALPAAALVPEPATWLTMILGFGLIGGALRSRHSRRVSAPAAA